MIRRIFRSTVALLAIGAFLGCSTSATPPPKLSAVEPQRAREEAFRTNRVEPYAQDTVIRDGALYDIEQFEGLTGDCPEAADMFPGGYRLLARILAGVGGVLAAVGVGLLLAQDDSQDPDDSDVVEFTLTGVGLGIGLTSFAIGEWAVPGPPNASDFARAYNRCLRRAYHLPDEPSSEADSVEFEAAPSTDSSAVSEPRASEPSEPRAAEPEAVPPPATLPPPPLPFPVALPSVKTATVSPPPLTSTATAPRSRR